MKQAIDESIPPAPSETGGVDEFIDFQDKSIPFKFKRLKERTPGEAWILLVYGPSKNGKTFFAGTCGPRTLFINVGDGIETLLSPVFKANHPEAENMIIVDVRELQGKSTDSAFDIVCDVINHALAKFPDQFDTIVLDEATAFRKYALNKAMTLVTAQRTKTRFARTEEYEKADVQDFGVEMDMVEWFLGHYIPKFKGAKKNFLMIAHERQIFSKPDKIGDEAVLKRVLPGFTGKTFPDKVPAYFDDVMRAEMASDASGHTVYRLRTAGNDSLLGGTRHGGTFNGIESNPNFLEMLNRIKSGQIAIKPQSNIKR